ncbi:MAG: zinc ribbon domain-containing protein [Conexivisphaerales archaeon]
MSTSLTTFRRLTLEFRKRNDELQTIYSQVVQNVGDRIYRAFKNFFEGRARFPKWKKQHNIITTLSLTYPQYGFNINPAKGLYLIFQASWDKFSRKAIFKARSLGKQLIFVDPWGTTQFCHRCLHWVPKELSEREHVCSNCGEQLARDMNSALLLKRLGIQRSPAPDGGSSPAERGPLPSLRGLVSPSAEAGSHRF